VNMWLRTGPRRNDDQVHGQRRRADRLSGNPDEVRQTLTRHDLAVWPDALDFGLLLFHGRPNGIAAPGPLWLEDVISRAQYKGSMGAYGGRAPRGIGIPHLDVGAFRRCLVSRLDDPRFGSQ
jgi:hypothetical protein